MYGAPGATRTPDTRFRKPLLYPPELQGHTIVNISRIAGHSQPALLLCQLISLTSSPDRHFTYHDFAEINRQLSQFLGGDRGIRTPDLCDANAALSQLSYIPGLNSSNAPSVGQVNFALLLPDNIDILSQSYDL